MILIEMFLLVNRKTKKNPKLIFYQIFPIILTNSLLLLLRV